MTALVDTNVLLTATTPARPLHEKALSVLNRWSELAVSGQVLREYLVVATRPTDVNGLGLSVDAAMANVEQFQERFRLLEETVAVFEQLAKLVSESRCRGKQIHDANLVATALAHDVDRILTSDAGHFRRFAPSVEVIELAEALA